MPLLSKVLLIKEGKGKGMKVQNKHWSNGYESEHSCGDVVSLQNLQRGRYDKEHGNKGHTAWLLSEDKIISSFQSILGVIPMSVVMAPVTQLRLVGGTRSISGKQLVPLT